MINKTLVIEDARIMFRNFAGKAGKYNAEGRRNFCVRLDVATAESLSEDGWHIRWLDPRDPDEERQPYMQVLVKYTNRPPKIVVITSKNKTLLDEDSVKMLDWAEIANIDLIINPFNWEVNGNTGVTAYVKTMYITLVEDEFESKYRDVPDSVMNIPDDLD